MMRIWRCKFAGRTVHSEKACYPCRTKCLLPLLLLSPGTVYPKNQAWGHAKANDKQA